MLIVFASAKLMAELFERMGQPGLVGEILAGVLIGPSVLHWIAPTDFLPALSDLGAVFLLAWGASANEAIFVGAAMVATSVGITAQVLSAKGLLQATASKIILAAAVIDDVLGLLVLAVVSGLTRGQFHVAELALTGILACGFTVIIAKWGAQAMGKVVPHVSRSLRVGEAQFAMAMCLMFALSVGAVYTGVAAIVGAFLAGLALAETT